MQETSLRIVQRRERERVELVCAALCTEISTAYLGEYCQTLVFNGTFAGVKDIRTPSSNFKSQQTARRGRRLEPLQGC